MEGALKGFNPPAEYCEFVGASADTLYTFPTHPRFFRCCAPPKVKLSYDKTTGQPTYSVEHPDNIGNDQPPQGFSFVSWIPKSFGCLQLDNTGQRWRNSGVRRMHGMDAASVACVWALQLEKTHVCLDLCTAPGCKAMAMADQAKQVFAIDISRKRLCDCYSLQKKLGYQNIYLYEADGTILDPENESTYNYHVCRARMRQKLHAPFKLPKTFDRVLVDAECTNDGSSRHIIKFAELPADEFERKVMARLRSTDLASTQFNLLLKGFTLLKEGGILVYSTCSFSDKQNGEIVERLLSRLPQARVVELPYSEDVPCDYTPVGDGRAALFGRRGRTEGLFVCKITKIPTGDRVLPVSVRMPAALSVTTAIERGDH